MQRRAAAAYAALFLLLAAGAYVTIGMAQAPTIALENADVDYSAGAGDEFVVDGRTYAVDEVTGAPIRADRETTLTWVNESETQTAMIDNDTTLSAVDVSWPGQTARATATFTNGTTVTYNDNEYTLLVGNGSLTFHQANQSEEFAVGDTFTYQGNETTVLTAGDDSATVAWGAYTLITQTTSPDSVEFRQAFNLSIILSNDAAVDDETVTRADGREYVVYGNGTTQLLDEYLPEPDVQTFSEGDSVTYNTAEVRISSEPVTVQNVTTERVVLSWHAPVTHEVTAAEGDNVTLGPNERKFFAHFPDNETLQLSSNLGTYQSELDVQDTYHERINGLWGISILSILAAVFLLGMAYLPSRY